MAAAGEPELPSFDPSTLPFLDDPRRSVRVAGRLALAAASAGLALATGWALEPHVPRPYFLPASIAFIVTAFAAGAWSGVLTSALFAVGHAVIHLRPHGTFALNQASEVLAVLGFFATGAIVSLLAGSLRSSHDRLRDRNRRLSAAQTQREDLLSALAHDIRSPLAVVTANAVAIARSAGKDDPEALRRRALLIERSATTIESMLGDLVEASTLESGHVVLERAPVDVAAFADELRARIVGTLDVERLRVVIPPDLPRAWVDPHRLERILVNLLSNALKYSPANVPVTLRAAQQGRWLVLSIEDLGRGIAPDDLPRIFDKYYRSHDARAESGLGLGLFITRLLVEAHGGSIRAESAPGAGTVFHVALPVCDPAR